MRSVRGMDADQGVAVAALVEQRKPELERPAPVALGDDPATGVEQWLERRRQLLSESVVVAIWRVEEDQIVLTRGADRPHAEAQRVLRGHLRRDSKLTQVPADRLLRGPARVDERRGGRPPRERLDGERPG